MEIHWIVTLLLCLPFAGIQDPPEPDAAQPLESELITADEAERDRLLREHDDCARGGDSKALVAVLRKMAAFDNEEFIAPGKAGLLYRPSKGDKEAAKLEAEELGLRDKQEIETLITERVSAVQAASASLLGNFPGDKKVVGFLSKAFADKELRKERPLALAAVVLSLGKLKHEKLEQDIFELFKRQPHPEVARSCVRYFGLIRSKDKSIVRTLCEELSAPEPGAVNSAANPPAGYWEQRWKTWNAIRRDVSWALKEITGQVFRPAEGEHPSDTRKALDYVKEHAKELGIR